jgi:hypothetical protein
MSRTIDPWSSGYNARPGNANPFTVDTVEHADWQAGREAADQDRRYAPRPGKFHRMLDATIEQEVEA